MLREILRKKGWQDLGGFEDHALILPRFSGHPTD
jgi:hypothetical protein